MTKRLFLAIDLPDKFKKELRDWQDNYQYLRGAKWTPQENLHITSAFLGDVEESKIGELGEKLEEVLTGIKPFNLEFKEVTLAPAYGEPRMIWVDFTNSLEFNELVKKVWSAALNYVVPEVYSKIKEPVIHITLARFRQPIYLDKLQQPSLTDKKFEVGGINLMESELAPERPYYKTILNFKF